MFYQCQPASGMYSEVKKFKKGLRISTNQQKTEYCCAKAIFFKQYQDTWTTNESKNDNNVTT